MNLKQRIKRIETAVLAKRLGDETYSITLDQWRRYAKGEDILPELPERRREAFLEWRKIAEMRQRQAEKTVALFAD